MDLQALDLTKPDAWSVVEGSSTKGVFPPDTQLAGALCDTKRGLVLVGGGLALVFDGRWTPLTEGLPTGEPFGQGVTTSDGRLFAVADSGVVEISDAGVRNVAPRPDGSVAPGGVTLIAVGTHVLRFTPFVGGRTPSVELMA